MTINMGYFEELRAKINNANLEQLIDIKKKIAEELERYNYRTRCGEDPMGGWFLYLDALCDVRLKASAWDTGCVLAFAEGELDLMADWYEALCEVARSISRRQKDGRGGCNVAKFSALKDIVLGKGHDIEEFIGGGNKYLAYLNDCTREIFDMEHTGNWHTLDKIQAFRGM